MGAAQAARFFEDPTIPNQYGMGWQVDLLYFAGHGVHRDGCLRDQLSKAYLYPSQIGTGRADQKKKGLGFSTSRWGRGLKWGIFQACSVLDALDLNDPDWDRGATRLPGYDWGKVTLGYPFPTHALLGFRLRSPGAPVDSEINEWFFDFCTGVAGGIPRPIVESWMCAVAECQRWYGCAIYHPIYWDEFLPGAVPDDTPPGYNLNDPDLRSEANPYLRFWYWTRYGSWNDVHPFAPWEHNINGKADGVVRVASADLTGVGVPGGGVRTPDDPVRVCPNRERPCLAPIIATDCAMPVRLDKSCRKRMAADGSAAVFPVRKERGSRLDDCGPVPPTEDAASFAAKTFGIHRSRLKHVEVHAAVQVEIGNEGKDARSTVNLYALDFLQDHHGIPIADSGIQVLVGADGVISARAKWSKLTSTHEHPRPVMPAKEAISHAAKALSISGSLGSMPAAEEAMLLYCTQSAHGKERTLVPAWRVWFSNDSVVTIDAFTGDLVEGR